MDPREMLAYEDSIYFCERLLQQLRQEAEQSHRCFHGEPLRAYLQVTELAIEHVKKLRNELQRLQQCQP